MSSDVHAKWMNSLAAASSAATSGGASAMRSFSQYSTAFTSWFVTASIALMRAASSRAKPSCSARIHSRVAAENGGSSAKPASDSATSQASSTRTRCAMKPASDSSGRSRVDLRGVASVERGQGVEGGRIGALGRGPDGGLHRNRRGRNRRSSRSGPDGEGSRGV